MGAAGNGLWGGKSQTATEGSPCFETGTEYWTDVALLRTDISGKASGEILTSSGVTDSTCGNPGENHCDPAIDDTPSLASGTYSNVRVTVHDVGTSVDETTPDISILVVGGDAVMFEWDVITFTIP